jgi:hypothetical protein
MSNILFVALPRSHPLSGGAAVSVALRMLPVADGSDQMGSFIAIACCGNEWSDNIAVSIAEGHDLVAPT